MAKVGMVLAAIAAIPSFLGARVLLRSSTR